MAEWHLTSAWAGQLPSPGRYGRAEGAPGVRIAPREGFSIATIVGPSSTDDAGIDPPPSAGEGACGAGGRGDRDVFGEGGAPLSRPASRATLPRGGGREEVRTGPTDHSPDVAAVLAAHLGLAPPEPRRASIADERSLVWSGPGQWLALAPGRDALRDLGPALAGLAAVTDQTDARALLRLSGPSARAALAKGFAIDLHPRAFPPGSAATTLVAHVGAQIWMVDDGPTYDIAVARSYAGSFWRWLAGASAAFGYVVEEAAT